jgi:hypothetical protein
MSSQLEISAAQATLNAVGARGSVAITGTSAVTAPTDTYFYCIDFMSDSVVAAQGNVTGATNATLSTLGTIPAKPVYGKFTSITLTSGTAIGYISRG